MPNELVRLPTLGTANGFIHSTNCWKPFTVPSFKTLTAGFGPWVKSG